VNRGEKFYFFMHERKLTQSGMGEPKKPLIRLKELSPEMHEKAMCILREHTYRDSVPLVAELVGFACSSDVLFRFYHWYAAKETTAAFSEKVKVALEFIDEYKDLTVERVRAVMGMFFMMRSAQHDDVSGFARMGRMSLQEEQARLREERMQFDRQKYEEVTRKCVKIHEQRFELQKLRFNESLRKKLDAGVDALTRVFQKNPEAMRHFQTAKELVRMAGPSVYATASARQAV
jgi:hypothetical protein